MKISGRIDIIATALEPIHHGAGAKGNMQLLRVQDIILPNGDSARVPFISGNSLKHMIREAGGRFALDAMGVEDGTLTKAVTDLLFSGGALTKVGSSINLERGRKLEALFPLLGLCGYSAGNVMTQSKVRVDNMHLACAENAWRMPIPLAELPPAIKSAGALRGQEFGTRHESSRRPYVAKVLTESEHLRLQELADKKEKGDSAQMIYDFQIVKPGSIFWGAFHLDDISEMEQAALKSALGAACEGRAADGGYLFRVGAKASSGYGLVSMQLSGSLREPVAAPEYDESVDLVMLGDSASDVVKYTVHLREHSEEIATALVEVMT